MSEPGLFRKVALERLASPEQLDQLLQGTSIRSWILLLALLGILAILVVWSVLGQVSTQLQARGALIPDDAGDGLHAVVYMTAHDASRIEPGMTALVIPAEANAQESGYLEGRVARVADRPAQVSDMLSSQIREPLAQQLDELGANYAVDVSLTPDSSSPSGYQWTSGLGPQGRLKIGATVAVSIIIARRRPIEMAIPTLKRVLPEPGSG